MDILRPQWVAVDHAGPMVIRSPAQVYCCPAWPVEGLRDHLPAVWYLLPSWNQLIAIKLI